MLVAELGSCQYGRVLGEYQMGPRDDVKNRTNPPALGICTAYLCNSAWSLAQKPDSLTLRLHQAYRYMFLFSE